MPAASATTRWSRGEHVWADVALRGGGWADFALLSDGLAADVTTLTAFVARPMVDGGRIRPDGVRLSWRTVRLHAPLPFMIEDITPRDLRVPRPSRHANGVESVDRLVLGAREPEPVRERYAALRAIGAPSIDIRAAERDCLLGVIFR